MLKMFKYELVVLALAFCALQYGRLQNDTTSRSFLQSDLGNDENQDSTEWADAEIRVSADETNITAMEQFLSVSAKLNATENASNDSQIEI